MYIRFFYKPNLFRALDHPATVFTIFWMKSLNLAEIKIQLNVIFDKKDRNTSALVI